MVARKQSWPPWTDPAALGPGAKLAEEAGTEMRVCGAEAIALLVQLVHGGGEQTLPPWAREPANRIVSRYHKATARLGREIDAQAKDWRR